MKTILTVSHAPSGRERDVVVEVDPESSTRAVVVAIARLLDVDATTSSEGVLIDGEPCDLDEAVVAGRVVDGSRVLIGAPSAEGFATGQLPSLRVVGGAGAGTIFEVTPGVTYVGADAACGVRIAGREMPAVAAMVHVDGSGRLTIAPTRQPDGSTAEVLVDRRPIAATTLLDETAVISIGGVLLGLARGGAAVAATSVADGGGALSFARPPRLLGEPPLTAFRYPAEPAQVTRRPIPIIAALAPLVMAGVMVTVFHNMAFLAFGLMSPLVMIGNYFYDRRSGRTTHRAKLADHRATKALIDADADAAVTLLQRRLRQSSPDPATVLDIALHRRSRLWERRRDDGDHLVLRIGTADRPSGVTIDDPSEMEHRRAVARPALDVPAVLSLRECGVVGVTGREDDVRPLAAWLVAQLVVLQSPGDVRLAVVTARTGEAAWSWLRWVPHVRADGGAHRLGTDAESSARRIAELVRELDERLRMQVAARGSRPSDDVVVVIDGARRLRAVPGVARLLKEGPAVGLYALCLDAEVRSLPEECAAIVTAGPSHHRLAVDGAADVPEVLADRLPEGWFDLVARGVAPVIDIDDEGDGGGLPASSRLLDVLDLEPPTSAAVESSWTKNSPTTRVVVGDSIDGAFAFDLRSDGPHGLVAGTTGSGKSELLQTIVASLAATNPPDDMTFVLIDYKGGAAFRDFVPMPHTVGMVTDLDAHLVERALASLGAELHRRERLLALADTKDIEDYTDARRRGEPLEPLPRLVIVIDEFASLVRELQDFVPGLVNIAQRGRSLGIHLILATQRPSGVISPEIRANTNLRIALRVTDAGESSDVIDAPDAARISKSTPGRALVRLGAGALLPFQAGRVGGRRPGPASIDDEPWVAPFGWHDLGRGLPRRPEEERIVSDAQTDLHELVASLASAHARQGGRAPHRPWLDALAPVITLDEIDPAHAVTGGVVPKADPAADGALTPLPLGLQDHPQRQAQEPLLFDLDADAHLYIVGASRSGRSQALRTFAAAVARMTTAADVHLYGLDCGTGALLPLTALPHTGAVVRRTQVGRARRLLSRLVDELATRHAALAAGGFADVVEQRRSVEANARMPHIVVLLDHWEGFMTAIGELDGGEPLEQVQHLLREGAGAGLHVIVSGDRSLLASRMGALCEKKIVLRLVDRADYGLVGMNPRALPDDIGPGRAFDSAGGAETQLAVVTADLSGVAQAAAVREWGALAASRDQRPPHAQTPFTIDEISGPVSFDEAWSRRAADGRADDEDTPGMLAMIGLGGDDLHPVGPDLADGVGTFMISGPAKSGRSTALSVVTQALLRQGIGVAIIAPRRSPLRALAEEDGVIEVFSTASLTAERLADAFEAGARVLIVDDAELVKDTPASTWLGAFVKSCADDESLGVVVACTAGELGYGFGNWLMDIRRNRAGALLSPQTQQDGDTIGVRLPRSLVSDRVRPGLAYVNIGDGELTTVHVPST
ncbi:FtsK/SpoIIIE domain-containing protein [Frigoribacterium sp. 2-23]|uniref:FtsK/SpoIIIE domain-containing protein n=1 Tax=Frigoribacterium sp. 2-23 TaxID=3415006 RepID=UPI003C704398